MRGTSDIKQKSYDSVELDASLPASHLYEKRGYKTVKPVKSAISLMPEAVYELPYEGAKEMLLVDDVDNKDFLIQFLSAMYDELPIPKKKNG